MHKHVSKHNEMKSKIFKYLVVVIFLITACDSLSKENFDVAADIASVVHADTYKLVFQKVLKGTNPEKKYYVELTIINSKLIDEGADPKLVASYCAYELHKRLDKKTIERNYGYELKMSEKSEHTYFFKKSEVKLASYGIKTMNKYFNFVLENNLKKAESILNLEEESDSVTNITSEIRTRIEKSKEKPNHFFGEYTNEIENDCWFVMSYINIDEENYITTKALIKKSNPEEIIYLEID